MPADVLKVKELFLAVLELPAHERAAYLDSTCAGDDALRQQMEAMLQSHQNSGELLPSPAELLAGRPATKVDAGSARLNDPSATLSELAPGAARRPVIPGAPHPAGTSGPARPL